ncbi:hypothetical protein C8Q80DRAFT_1120869 [Daedaleopsis nitida]|nr:hypothetical protein C8Q80DRAFT_1120869 [Daedaleopsis nitida]
MTYDCKMQTWPLITCTTRQVVSSAQSFPATRKSKEETIKLAVKHTEIVRRLTDECTATHGTVFRYEYSPEMFSQTEPEFELEVCEAVKTAWGRTGPGDERKIFDLPATVEIGLSNHFADLSEKIIIRLHPHNDRGTSIAAAELGMLAGADRIEGCLFGNGERTGTVNLVNLAMNLYTQGISPGVDFSHIQAVVDVVTACNDLPSVHQRHPYGGEFAFTTRRSPSVIWRKGVYAYYGQSKKGHEEAEKHWDIPYLPT